MKRIKLYKRLHSIIDTTYMLEKDYFKYKDKIIEKLIKLIGNNYRRRVHKPYKSKKTSSIITETEYYIKYIYGIMKSK